jgi:hypothetical protein
LRLFSVKIEGGKKEKVANILLRMLLIVLIFFSFYFFFPAWYTLHADAFHVLRASGIDFSVNLDGLKRRMGPLVLRSK